jgi:transposase-like protein
MEDYPKNLSELEERFGSDQACREYLFHLRWPEGYICPRCGHRKAWPMRDGWFRCAACDYKCSITSGTIFEGTRKSLVLWFRAIWWVTSQKSGASAKSVQRILELGSYQTAWAWLHKLRRAMVRPGRDRLSGTVEVDETYIGGERPGKRGRGADGKALVAIAVEDKAAKKIGRIRLSIIPDASSASLTLFAQQCVEKGSTVRTDDWPGYSNLRSIGCFHEVVKSTDLKIAHLGVSLLKRWLLGTHQGAVSHEHLNYYLDEFTFRFNRRTSNHRGKLFYRLLEHAMEIEPTTYRAMVRNIRGRKSSNHKI